MFSVGGYYRHKYTLDTDILVQKVQYIGPDYIKLKVHFVDRKHTGHFELNSIIKIKKKDYLLWDRVV